MPRKLISFSEARRRLGVGNTKFYADFVNTGKLRTVRLGPRAVRVAEDELDRLIDELPLREVPQTA
jgi:excisionase family DNA binding protein